MSAIDLHSAQARLQVQLSGFSGGLGSRNPHSAAHRLTYRLTTADICAAPVVMSSSEAAYSRTRKSTSSSASAWRRGISTGATSQIMPVPPQALHAIVSGGIAVDIGCRFHRSGFDLSPYPSQAGHLCGVLIA